MDENLKLPKWTEEYEKNLSVKSKHKVATYPYKQVIGSLLYLAMWTRPDITYAVHPTLEAVHACKRILEYLSLTKHLGLNFFPGNKRLTCLVDSSFADVIDQQKSTGGLIQYLGYSPIYWETLLQIQRTNTFIYCQSRIRCSTRDRQGNNCV
jgi:hypothetical protein